MATAPDVSVVCSTFERAHKLPALFAALEAQTLDPERFEVIIVNDGSRDDTATTLEQLARGSKLHIRVVTLETNHGRAEGRNVGWRAARAPVVAFTDDDCAPTSVWLEEGLRALTAAGASVVVGRTDPNPEQLHNMGAFSRTQRVTEASGTRYFHTCNIFYQRDVLERLGGFDRAFRHKGGEDTDLGWRALDAGGAVAFASDAVVLHDVSAGTFRAALKEASMWLDIPRVVHLHPARARKLLVHGLFWKKTHELLILALGGIVLSVVVRNPIPLVGALPWASHRARKWPIVADSPGRFLYLPHAFVLDVVELTAMVRGSLLNRTLVL